MEKPATYSWLDDYLAAVKSAIGFMDLTTIQPVIWREVQSRCATARIVFLEELIRQSREKAVPIEDLARRFPSGSCRVQLVFTSEDFKTARLPRPQRLAIAGFFHSLLRAQMEGDFFCRGRTNRLRSGWIPTPTQDAWVQGSPAAAGKLGQVWNAAYNLGCATYTDNYVDYAIENYGPYPLAEGRILVIKHARNLHARQIWPGSRSRFPNDMRWYCVYQDVAFMADYVSCHCQYQGDIISGLKQWAILADGKWIRDWNALDPFTQAMAEAAAKRWRELTALRLEPLTAKSLEILAFQYKPLCDRLGLDWREQTAGAENRPARKWSAPDDLKEAEPYWLKVWDPRVDFYG